MTGTVIVRSGGKVVNTLVPNNNRVRHTTTITCIDAGLMNFQTVYTGDEVNKGGSKGKVTLRTDGITLGNGSPVKQLVPGPGIYMTPRDGQGTVVISLEPLRELEVTDGYDDITWTISDLGKPNETDQSAFIVVGGTGGLNAGDGICLRSRDGVNFVELNNKKPAQVGLLNVQAVQSAQIPGSGLAYFASNNIVNTSTFKRIGLENFWGVEGRTDTSGCGWCGDDLVYEGPNLSEDGTNNILDRQQAFPKIFYQSGNLLDVGTRSAIISFGSRARGTYAVTTASIYSYNQWPLDYQVPGAGNKIVVQSELSVENFAFRDATSDLVDYDWADWNCLAVGGLFTSTTASSSNQNVIYKSNRTAGAAGTWTQVYSDFTGSTGSIITSIAYGNDHWIACGFADTMWISTNTTTWTKSSTVRPGSNWRKIVYGDGRFVAVGSSGRISYTTDNGATWTAAQSGTTSTLQSVAFSPDLCRFVAVGDNRTIVSVKV